MREDETRPLPRADLVYAELDGETVVYDRRTRTLHHLNPTATIVWAHCDGRHTVDAIIDAIVRTRHADQDAIRTDVIALVERLTDATLLVDASLTAS